MCRKSKPVYNPALSAAFYPRRWLLMALFLGLWVSFHLVHTGPSYAAPIAQSESAPVVHLLTFEGAVTPILERYIEQAITDAAQNGHDAVVLRLDTPGGSVEVTKSITQRMLASPIPVIIYVAPIGAHAGSAGTFITLAGHVAAMAPGTSIGAASPVTSEGQDVGETMEAKVKNILSADIENLAERRGERAVEWAIAAVQEAAAATATEALELGVIDVIAADVPDLLNQIDGQSVQVAGQDHILRTRNATLLERELSPVQQVLNFLSDPSIASILLSLGLLGLIVEIRSPGFGVPGILGAICLLLAFYALGQLDANLTGLTLIVIALALFVAEAFTPTFGVLAIGGAVAFALGGALLFDAPGIPVPWLTIIMVAALLAVFAGFAGIKAIGAQQRPVITGAEALVGQEVSVRSDLSAGESGSVFVLGEWWTARLVHGELSAGEHAQVVRLEGHTLIIKPAATSATSNMTPT